MTVVNVIVRMEGNNMSRKTRTKYPFLALAKGLKREVEKFQEKVEPHSKEDYAAYELFEALDEFLSEEE